jgi:hypothetical protein
VHGGKEVFAQYLLRKMKKILKLKRKNKLLKRDPREPLVPSGMNEFT